MFVSYAGFFFFFYGQEFVEVLFPFPLQSRAAQEGWLVGWLHRKGNGLCRTADGGQHVLTLQKRTQMSLHAYILRIYVFKIVTQLKDVREGDSRCPESCQKGKNLFCSDLSHFPSLHPHHPHREPGKSSEAFVFTSTGISAGFSSQRQKEFSDVRWKCQIPS